MFWLQFDIWIKLQVSLSVIIDFGLKLSNGLIRMERSYNQLNYILKVKNHLVHLLEQFAKL